MAPHQDILVVGITIRPHRLIVLALMHLAIARSIIIRAIQALIILRAIITQAIIIMAINP